ncbi:RNA 3'-terminal phosphate cyclase [Candidatus Methanoperedenaceae archaeon GB37]|nr:RNA 3'-terminal phosphate cyclase [Candidatus Methanoperedenaceae archaeon GB37]
MIVIDGSFGEGGGQIVRTAIALSAVTDTPIKIEKIRVGRSQPGLKAQHVKAIETVARLSRAEYHGVDIGSREITFAPNRITGGAMRVDIGTAGSIPLLIQSVIPLGLVASDRITLRLIGGTDVLWSPSIDYTMHVFFKALSEMGFDLRARVIARGYYPRGGGVVDLEILPSSIRPYRFEASECGVVSGISHASNLPIHVVKRQRVAASEILSSHGFECDIVEEPGSFESTGSGITLWCGHIGACSFGKRGLRAELVGSEAASVMVSELKSGAGVDRNLADQLIPYIGLAGGGSLTVRELSSHTETSIHVVEQLLNVSFLVDQRGDMIRISL